MFSDPELFRVTESEMKVVYEARAQSRIEMADLERLTRRLKENYLNEKKLSEPEFNQRWPKICSEALRQAAYRPLNR